METLNNSIFVHQGLSTYIYIYMSKDICIALAWTTKIYFDRVNLVEFSEYFCNLDQNLNLLVSILTNSFSNCKKIYFTSVLPTIHRSPVAFSAAKKLI